MKVQRQDVIATALALLDEVGVDGLTMRRLAQALHIQAPSLYWHFAGKQALLDAMADALLADMALPSDDGLRWDAWVRAVALEFRRALKARRDGARVYAGTFPMTDNNNVLRISDRIIGVLRAAGADERTAVHALFTMQYFVLGFTIEEQATMMPPPKGEGVELARLVQAMTDDQITRYPNAASAAALLATDDDDARFRFGLDRLIDGLRVVIP